jgi:hypothetical protein
MSMVSRLGVVVLIALSLCLGPGIVSAHAAPPSSLGCAGPPDSVFNQYCEPVPTATGGKTPGPGTPAVATTLPPAVVQTISGGQPVTGAFAFGPARKKLVTLPVSAPSVLPVTGTALANPWSLAWWMILILVAIALALIATAIVRRRRRRPAGPAAPAA